MSKQAETFFELKSEDMTHLGGPMGSDYTKENWHKLFKSLGSAKACAERDYNKQIKGLTKGYRKLCWKEDGYGGWTTGDLLFVMYTIKRVSVSD
jgi:hypothetical protein